MPVHAASLADLADLVPLFSAYLDFYEVPAPEEQVRAFLAERLRGRFDLFLARDAEARALGFVNSIRCSPPGATTFVAAQRSLRPPGGASPGCRRGPDEPGRGFAESMGACGLQLETAKTNHAGQSLYERLGYVRDEQFYTYWLQL